MPNDPSWTEACPDFVDAAITTWFQVGGRRIDDANGYHQQDAVGLAIRKAPVPRSEIFCTSCRVIGGYLSGVFCAVLRQTEDGCICFMRSLCARLPARAGVTCATTSSYSINIAGGARTVRFFIANK